MDERKSIRTRKETVFGENLKRLREEKGVSLRMLAATAGVSPAVVHAWELGGAPQDLNAVLKICKFLEVDFQWMLTGVASGEQSKPPEPQRPCCKGCESRLRRRQYWWCMNCDID